MSRPDTARAKWRRATLAEICDPPQYGFTARAGSVGDVRLLRITDLTDDGVDWSKVPFCECASKEFEKYALSSGDIVIARIGATTGKSYLIGDPPPAVFASYLIRVRARQRVDTRFL